MGIIAGIVTRHFENNKSRSGIRERERGTAQENSTRESSDGGRVERGGGGGGKGGSSEWVQEEVRAERGVG